MSDHKEFGAWFKVDLDQPFVAGQRSTGTTTYPGYEGYAWLAWVQAVEAPRYLSFEWTPGPDVPDDPGTAPRTLVEFRLEPEGAEHRPEQREREIECLHACFPRGRRKKEALARVKPGLT